MRRLQKELPYKETQTNSIIQETVHIFRYCFKIASISLFSFFSFLNRLRPIRLIWTWRATNRILRTAWEMQKTTAIKLKWELRKLSTINIPVLSGVLQERKYHHHHNNNNRELHITPMCNYFFVASAKQSSLFIKITIHWTSYIIIVYTEWLW